jgi:carbon-monoxide dehydrogenase iron sulfur subunit
MGTETEKIILVNSKTCMSCHSCEIACAVAHSESKRLVEAVYEQQINFPRIILERSGDEVLPIHCRHCEEAPCVTVCPSGAVSRPAVGSPVLLDQSLCIGCHACIIVCPFGVIKQGKDGKSLIKCDLCFGRLEEGREPACVEACPTSTIRFVSIEEIGAQKRREYARRYRVSIQALEGAKDENGA